MLYFRKNYIIYTKRYDMKKINKDMTLGEVLKNNKHAEKILLGFGMHCLSCPFSQMETLEQAAVVHGVDLDLMLSKLNEQNEPKPIKTIKVRKKKN